MGLNARRLPPGAIGRTDTRVLLAMLELDRCTVRAVALRSGLSFGTTYKALVRLRLAGLVTWNHGGQGTLRPLVAVATRP